MLKASKFLRLKNLGLKTLLNICGIETHPNIYHVGYMLGPRINAWGRVGKSSHGANLLLNNPQEVFKIATELEQFNKERQYLEKDVLDKIQKEIKIDISEPVIIISGKIGMKEL